MITMVKKFRKTESLSLRRRTFSIFYFLNSLYTAVTDNLNSQPVWIAENSNILLNKNFLMNIPFSLNSQFQFAPGYFLTSQMIQNPPIPRFWFNMILQYYFIAVFLSIQTERGHDFPFENTMTTLWSRYIRRATKISVHYRVKSQFIVLTVSSGHYPVIPR